MHGVMTFTAASICRRRSDFNLNRKYTANYVRIQFTFRVVCNMFRNIFAQEWSEYSMEYFAIDSSRSCTMDVAYMQ